MKPVKTYEPRLDQIEAVMKRQRVDMEAARAICVKNYELWRDLPREWKWIQTDSGGYVQVEKRKR